MPTENRSSNTEMASVPREHELKIRQTPLADLLSGLKTGEIRDCSDREFAVGDTVLLREIDDGRDYTGTVARRTITHVQKHYGLPDHLCVLSYGKPAEQHQGEPIMLTAVATLVDDGDGGLEPSWLLEGGTAELLAGMTLLVAENAPELCQEDGSAEVYTRADPGEVERLRTALKFYADREHYHFESGNWDTVSGEPLNILWCGDEPDFIEDGSVARAALEQKP